MTVYDLIAFISDGRRLDSIMLARLRGLILQDCK